VPRRPLDILNAVFVAILLALTLVAGAMQRLQDWPALSLRFGAMLAGIAAISRVARWEERNPLARILVNFYPLVLIPLIFDSMGRVIPAVHPVEYDAPLAAIDRALFGVDVTVAMQPLLWPPLTDLLHLAYATYYFLPIVVTLALWRRDVPRARRFIFTIVLAFYVSYAGYFLVPAKGPRYHQAHLYTTELVVSPISTWISATLNNLENLTKHDAFPSGHTMIAVMCLIVAARHARRAFWFLLPAALGLVFSTMYCRYHYAVDVVAGLVLAGIMVPVGQAVWDRYDRRASAGEGTTTRAAAP
jgi:membrane-associated phospholipid phosphatase